MHIKVTLGEVIIEYDDELVQPVRATYIERLQLTVDEAIKAHNALYTEAEK